MKTKPIARPLVGRDGSPEPSAPRIPLFGRRTILPVLADAAGFALFGILMWFAAVLLFSL